MVLFNSFIGGRCLDVWKCIITIYILTSVLDQHYHLVEATGRDCIFVQNTTTSSTNETKPYTLLHCGETCCCNIPSCCLCNTSSTSGLTFIPCDVDTAIPVSTLPPLQSNWEKTEYPLYEECYEKDVTQHKGKGKGSNGISNTALIAMACVFGLLALIAFVGILIYAFKRKNRKTMQVEDERKLRPMTPGPRATYLHLPDIHKKY